LVLFSASAAAPALYWRNTPGALATSACVPAEEVAFSRFGPAHDFSNTAIPFFDSAYNF
jgi:hypothetical protein